MGTNQHPMERYMTKQLTRTLIILSISTYALLASCLSVTPQTFVASADGNSQNSLSIVLHDPDTLVHDAIFMNDRVPHQGADYLG